VDAHSLVIDPAISPCVFLPPEDFLDVYVLVTADHNKVDSGAFYLKVHQLSVDLLTRTLNHPLARPENDLGWFGEHAAMATVIRAIDAEHRDRTNSSGIAWIPRAWINYQVGEYDFDGEPGSFMIHVADMDETRQAHMITWLNELQRNQARWNIPLEHLSLKDEISEFWRSYTTSAVRKE